MVEKRVDILVNTFFKQIGDQEKFNSFMKGFGKLKDRFSSFDVAGEKFKQNMDGFNKQFVSMEKNLQPLKNEVKKVFDSFTEPSLTAEQAVGKIISKQKDLANFSKAYGESMKSREKVNLFAKALGGFRMEMLGIMFLGMGIQRFFSGLLKPAGELTGIFELLNLTLGLVFLPIMLFLLDLFLPIMNAFISLPEGVKMFLGALVLAGAVIGGFLFIVGMMALGLNSIFMFFTGPLFAAITGWFSGISTALAGFGAVFAVIFIVIIAAIIGFIMAWKENFGNIREWTQILFDGIKNIFSGIADYFKGIIDIVVGLFSGDSNKIIEGVKLLWKGVVNIFKGSFQLLVGLIAVLSLALFRAFLGLLESIGELLGKGFGLLWEKLLVPMFEFGVNIVKSIIEGIKSIGGQIYSFILSLIPKKLRNLVSGALGGTGESADDFVMQGGKLVKTNPQDTIVGYKGASPFGGGDSASIVRALESMFSRIEININAPSGYTATARMSGGRI